MLPVAGKPCVQWTIEELVEAGIKDIIFVYSKGQEMVKEYFAEKTWYDKELIKRGKEEEEKTLKAVRDLANFSFVEQKGPLGDGHAILQAKKFIKKNEPFLVVFGDCLYAEDQVTEKLQNVFQQTKTCAVAVQMIPLEKASQFGVVTKKSELLGQGFFIQTMIEKPTKTLSNLAIIGRYLLTPSIWEHLEKGLNHSGEIRLIDALRSLQKKEPVAGVIMKGKWLDTGTLEGIKEAEKALS